MSLVPLLAFSFFPSSRGQAWPFCQTNHSSIAAPSLYLDATEYGIPMTRSCHESDCTWTDRFEAPLVGVCSIVCHQAPHCTHWSFQPKSKLCRLFSAEDLPPSSDIEMSSSWRGDLLVREAGSFSGSEHCFASHLLRRPTWYEVSQSCWSSDFRLMDMCCSLAYGYKGYHTCWLNRPGEPDRSFEKCCLGMLEGPIGRMGVGGGGWKIKAEYEVLCADSTSSF